MRHYLDKVSRVRPPSDVLAAFGSDRAATKVDGGQGTTWRSGDLILKPLDMPLDALQWLDHAARPLAETSELRLSLPARSQSGELVVDGWTAFPYLSGTHPVRQWKNIADVARRFAAAFAEVERPDFVAQRTDAWARADRFAWGEDVVAVPRDVPHVAPLVAARGELDEPPGIVHADLAGNVLFDPVERPAVIDLSLYWRPVEYSVAIIAIDAVCFEGAPLALLHTISATNEFSQYLVRALLFRIVTDALNHRDAYASYDAAVKHVLMLGRGRRPANRLPDGAAGTHEAGA